MQTPTLNINAPHFQPNLHQAPAPPLAQNNQSTNYHTNQQQMHTLPTQPFNTQLLQSFNPQVPPPYVPQYPPTNSPSANSTDFSILLGLQKQWERQERLDMECNEMERQKEERKRMKEEREQRKEDRKQVEKHENQQKSRINKAFEKIPRFDGTNPSYCFDWLEQTEALVNEHQGRSYREELLLNCGTSMSKTIHTLPQGATNQHIKDVVLRNHSNLRTVSQRSNAYHQLHQKPDEALQTYNTRYASFFNLAYPELELDNPLSRMHCIHYASLLYGNLGDKMTGRFNQDLPENLQTAFEKATNFGPRIITKQSINNRKVHEVNHIDITHGEQIKAASCGISGNVSSLWGTQFHGLARCSLILSSLASSMLYVPSIGSSAKAITVPQRLETLPEIPHDAAFICSPADVPGPCKVQLQDKTITTDIRQKFEELCEEYGEAFSKNDEDIGRTKLVKMDIDTGDSPPVSSRPYTLPLKHYEWVQREIESLERAGVITKSMSKWASPIVVPKNSAPGEPPKRRLCVDFRKVNKLQQEVITAGKNKGQISIHPLPKIDEMYAKLKGSKVFSTIDLRSGYQHITLGKSSRAKTAFVTPFG